MHRLWKTGGVDEFLPYKVLIPVCRLDWENIIVVFVGFFAEKDIPVIGG